MRRLINADARLTRLGGSLMPQPVLDAMADAAGQPVPRCLIEVDPAVTGLTATELQRWLWDGDPAIAVALATPNAISLTPDVIDGADEQIILARLDAVLSGASVPA